MTDFSGEIPTPLGRTDPDIVLVHREDLERLQDSLQQERLKAHVTQVMLLGPLLRAVESGAGIQMPPPPIETPHRSPEERDESWRKIKAEKQAYLSRFEASRALTEEERTDRNKKRLLHAVDPVTDEFDQKYPIIGRLLSAEVALSELTRTQLMASKRHLENILHKLNKLTTELGVTAEFGARIAMLEQLQDELESDWLSLFTEAVKRDIIAAAQPQPASPEPIVCSYPRQEN